MKKSILVIAVIALVAVAVFGGQALAGKPDKAPSNAEMYDMLLTMNLSLSDIKEQGDSIEAKIDEILNSLSSSECVIDADCSICEECEEGICVNRSLGTDCGICTTCDGLGNCVHDDTQDADCPDTPCSDGCDIAPDGIPGTWDWADDVQNECLAVNTCSTCTEFECSYETKCNVTICSAVCDATHPCPDTVCPPAYCQTEYILVEYLPASNACLGDCTCEQNPCVEEVTYMPEGCTTP
jgi:hypothetical protein